MRHLYLLTFLFLSFSCSSRSQEKERIETAQVEKERPPLSTDTLHLLFVGDLMQHTGQIKAAQTAHGYDYSSYFTYVKKEIEKADIAIGNLEVTLGGQPYTGYPAFSAPDEYAKAIQTAGFDVLLTANNHSLDRGKKGLERTLKVLGELQMTHTGTFKDSIERKQSYPLLIEKKGFRIALLNYTYGTNGLKVTPPNIVNYIDTIIIAQDIERAKALNPHTIIACMHWGNEYQSLPSKQQKYLSTWLLSKGVNHIIGSHTHVVQPIEVRASADSLDRHLVVYSLGNFVSNMSARKTDGGLIVNLKLAKDSTVRMIHSDYMMVYTGRPSRTYKKNHILYPVQMPIDSIPVNIRNSLNIFKKDARSLFKTHNIGIKEQNIFEKK